ncbi:MAG TPA: hypothetical protein VK183_09470 [Flavobacterium sp.]|jgi:hypothetical protein|nr:hypothetical protein [Flavobacterium sp.]
MKRSTAAFLLVFGCSLVLLLGLDYVIATSFLCPNCGYEEDILYLLFFYENSDTAHQSFPTLFNIAVVVGLAFFSGRVFRHFVRV